MNIETIIRNAEKELKLLDIFRKWYPKAYSVTVWYKMKCIDITSKDDTIRVKFDQFKNYI